MREAADAIEQAEATLDDRDGRISVLIQRAREAEATVARLTAELDEARSCAAGAYRETGSLSSGDDHDDAGHAEDAVIMLRQRATAAETERDALQAIAWQMAREFSEPRRVAWGARISEAISGRVPREAADSIEQAEAIDCPLCGVSVKQVASATLGLALFQHVNWACEKKQEADATVARLTEERDAATDRLGAIDALARIERMDEATSTSNLTDVQRLLRLTEAIASLRLDLLTVKAQPGIVQAACEAAVKNLQRAEQAEARATAAETERDIAIQQHREAQRSFQEYMRLNKSRRRCRKRPRPHPITTEA